jgi:hypothetical protein
METQNRLLNNSCERHVFEDFVDSLEYRIRLIDILVEFHGALICKAHGFVYTFVFHTTSKHVDLVEVLEFQ